MKTGRKEPVRFKHNRSKHDEKRMKNRTAVRTETEQEFLSAYRIEDYERPSLTADIVAFMIRSEETENYKKNAENRLSVLLIKRGGHPFIGRWALPGGFLQPGETIEACALREVVEETNVRPVSLMPIGVFSEPGRDPRGWIISNVFASIISEESVKQAGGDDASDAQWFDVDFEEDADGTFRLELTHGEIVLKAVLEEQETKFGKTSFACRAGGDLAFDHAKMIATALTALREGARNVDFLFDFLPETFTLAALQKVQETILQISVLPANFRRKVSPYVEETDAYTQGAGHRPARLYRRRKAREEERFG